MHIHLNPLTTERLQKSLGAEPGYLKLFYDTEGCGCNGMLAIQIVPEPSATDIQVPQEPFVFLLDAQQESLFDESMKLEAEVNYPSYKLTSDSSLFGSNIRVQDLR